ncbi:hypothetical protein TEA_023519 [Camellia sinensis var. sinensis]|uniref:AB hydrolase-1 domain-containing protein n=1 Tax=Camellia sinensis var. sinensis TaxID=542762 RepID=A0A4S4D061_CAMSN|nr:hypothetical protein TEA_023519 [Camellia sinensis var. sinensis]
MARTMRNKSGLAVLNRFLSSPSLDLRRTTTTTRSLETLAFEEVRASTTTEKPYNFTAFWRLVLVDLRNHGRSAEIESLSPPHDMANAAKDVADLVKSQGWAWPDVVLGHSMGGKVALQFAESCARGDYGQSAQLPKQHGGVGLSHWSFSLSTKKWKEGQLWVLDSGPGKVNTENSDGEVEKVLQTLQSLPTSVPSRKWLVDHMIKLGFSKSLSEWIGSNLKKSGDHETWAFNLDGAVQMFNSYRETDYWPLLEHPPKEMEIAIVQAEKSDRWDADVIQRLESLAGRSLDESEGKFSVHVLPNSGHWVHVDNPKGLLEIVAPRIASIA